MKPQLHPDYPLVGVLPSDFVHEFGKTSTLHGPSHVNRVIVLGGLLCKELNVHPAIARAVWAACYLHDLARWHEWACHLHGGAALPLMDSEKIRRTFKQAGLRADLGGYRECVAVAVALHCTGIDEVGLDCTGRPDSSLILQILKDADALDRVRLGDLDRALLRFDSSDTLIPVAKHLHAKTGDWTAVDIGMVLSALGEYEEVTP